MSLQKVKKKSCTILISITIALEHLQQDHLTSIFPLGGKVKIYWKGESLAAVPMSLILFSSSEGVMTSEL